MSERQRSGAFEQLRDFVMDHRRTILAVGRRHTDLDPEDLMQSAFSAAVGHLARAENPAELESRLARMLDVRYWFRAVQNQGHDQHDKVRHEVVTDLDAEPSGHPAAPDGDPVTEDVVSRVSTATRNEALGCALRTLVRRAGRYRGQVGQVEHPHLTVAQWGLLQTLADLAQEDRPLRGLQSEAARRLGVSRSAVAEQRATILLMLLLTRYLAGVLAPPRTLLSEQGVDRALLAYETWLDRASDRGVGSLIPSLATAVRTYADSGTRARLCHLPDRGLDELTLGSTVHDLEAGFARFLGHDQPNCAACCAPHNPTPDRTTEF